jgi:AcrR family transcriptional regulator|tara:strand:+ start:3680 stop:4312 length:633 start_codon:yes stop_codon:yes gene_type:complete
MSKHRGSNKEMADSTRQKFLDKAHDRFISEGYVATSTNDIVRDAEMARGALYHHFKNKQELFTAVANDKNVAMRSLLDARIEKRAQCGVADPQEDFLATLDLIIDLFKDPAYRRIIVIESLVALPHEIRRKTMLDYYRPLCVNFLDRSNISKSATPDVLDAFIIGLIGFIAESVRSFEYTHGQEECAAQAESIKAALRLFLIPFINQFTK